MYRHRLINLFLLYRITKITTITIKKIIPTLIPAASPDLDFGFSAEIRANSSQHSSFKTIFNIIKLSKRLCLSLYIYFSDNLQMNSISIQEKHQLARVNFHI